jgi:hypothetical protein
VLLTVTAREVGRSEDTVPATVIELEDTTAPFCGFVMVNAGGWS